MHGKVALMEEVERRDAQMAVILKQGRVQRQVALASAVALAPMRRCHKDALVAETETEGSSQEAFDK